MSMFHEAARPKPRLHYYTRVMLKNRNFFGVICRASARYGTRPTMKTQSRIGGYIFRSSAAALLFSCGVVALSSAINPKFPTPQSHTAFGVSAHAGAASVAAPPIQRNRTLTFADRVAYQRAIEEVYWQHRIWPKTNAGPKPPLDKVMSQAEIENKVEGYLRNAQALEDYWQRPITPDQLQDDNCSASYCACAHLLCAFAEN